MSDWISFHIATEFTSASIDSVLANRIAPALKALRATGCAEKWFYVRYGEGGPHIRLRIKTETETSCETRRLVGELLPNAVENCYVPETKRYGGDKALLIAEDHFCYSSDVGLSIIQRLPLLSGDYEVWRRAYAFQLAAILLGGAGFVGPCLYSFLEFSLPHELKKAPAPAPSDLRDLAAVLHYVRGLVAGGPHNQDMFGKRWFSNVSNTFALLRRIVSFNPADSLEANAPFVRISHSYLHMLFNRLGIHAEDEVQMLRLLYFASQELR